MCLTQKRSKILNESEIRQFLYFHFLQNKFAVQLYTALLCCVVSPFAAIKAASFYIFVETELYIIYWIGCSVIVRIHLKVLSDILILIYAWTLTKSH